MKKTLIVLLACLLFLAGCGGQPAASRTNGTNLATPSSDNPGEASPAPNGGPDKSPAAPGQEQAAAPPDTSGETGTAPGGGPDQAPPKHGAPPPIDTGTDVIEIKEKMFIAQTNDIYINPQDYLGKTIKYEGIFVSQLFEQTGQTYYFVIRYGPGCCGYDGEAGFEIVWPGDYPEDDDWVEAVGVLEEYEEDGLMYLRLNLSSLAVLDTRGEEFVYQ